MLKLNDEWNGLFQSYEQDHQNPTNQACHKVGIPMILASLPLGASLIGLPLAVPLFTVGWGFQFIGHAFEGKAPSFVSDRRSLVVGALWWFEKVGLPLVDRARPAPAA
jgi:uncharacterized membrane protein YGL010W